MADVAAAIQGQIRKFVFKVALRREIVTESHMVLWLERKSPTSNFQIQICFSFHLSALETRFIPKKSALFSLGVG